MRRWERNKWQSQVWASATDNRPSKKEKCLFVNCKKKALFVNIAGLFCMPFNGDFRVTEIPE
jgi:hypothetical protein